MGDNCNMLYQIKIIISLFSFLLCLPILSQELQIMDNEVISFGQPNQSEVDAFVEDGVTLVVDLRGPNENRGYDEQSYLNSINTAYYSLPVIDEGDINFDNARLLQTLINDADGKVLVHCGSGNRVGALMSLIGSLEGMDKQEAIEFGIQNRLGGLINTVNQVIEE